MPPVPLSVLDLAPVPSGSSASDVLQRVTDLAQLADRLGYARVWFAEHHGMPSIASSSPELLIAHAAGATEQIRVGSGGVMLPNHVPLQVAERFHTLEALHPGRIDLGIGRAPGTDPLTSRALRSFDASQFPQQLAELQGLSAGTLTEDHPFRDVRVVPGDVALPPIWILGSSGASARFAGQQGLGYAFATHFSPAPAAPALEAYREHFEPSERFPEPHAILAVSAVVAETGARAEHLAKTLDLTRVRLQRQEHAPLPSPEEAQAYDYSPQEEAVASKYRDLQIIGTPKAVRADIAARVEKTGADEVMVTSLIHDHAERLHSYELLAAISEMRAPADTEAESVTG